MGRDLASEALNWPANWRETLRALVGFTGPAWLPQLTGRLADELAEATRPAPIEPMAQLAARDELSPQATFRLRAGLRPRLGGPSDGCG